MKKVFLIVAGIILFDALLLGGVFYYKNLRGIGPAVRPPAGDIVKDIAVQAPAQNNTDFPLRLPDGFSVSIFAKDLGKPRVLRLGPDGNLWVSVPEDGKIFSLQDSNGDGVADENKIVIDGLNKPHGLATYCASKTKCSLYIGETDQVSAADIVFADGKMTVGQKRKVVDLPGGGGHFTRTIVWLPEQEGKKLLVAVGSSCNVCRENDTRRAAISIVDVRTGELKPYAIGLRNAVFMTAHPVTGEVWATEMGRDFLSDNLPPDEINIIKQGKNYGWPICFGNNIHDVDFDHNTYITNPCLNPLMMPSFIDIPAHSAPLGLAFFPEAGWPQEYWHNLLVAYHGSWNRSVPTGYKIVRYKLDARGNILGQTATSTPADGSASSPQAEDFITGWLQGGQALGRPVDILVLPGGVMYISDDKAGVVYRVAYGKNRTLTQNVADKKDLIQIARLKPDDAISSPLSVEGQARGSWFFEASFPVKVVDAGGRELGTGIAQANGEWMTADFVPFTARVSFDKPLTDTGFIIFHKDNPSGLPEHDDMLVFPVRFK